MKKKLEEHFGDGIVIAEVNGKAHVVTLCSNAAQYFERLFQHNTTRYGRQQEVYN
jgi:hypothetical protein